MQTTSPPVPHPLNCICSVCCERRRLRTKRGRHQPGSIHALLARYAPKGGL